MSIVGKGEGVEVVVVEDIEVGDWFARILTVFEDGFLEVHDSFRRTKIVIHAMMVSNNTFHRNISSSRSFHKLLCHLR